MDREAQAALNEPYNTAKEAGEDLSGYHYYQLNEQVGKDGVELAFESWLRGKEGTRAITTDQNGKITSELYSIEPEPGGTVALTIDIDFQAQVEAILTQSVEAMNAEDVRSFCTAHLVLTPSLDFSDRGGRCCKHNAEDSD